MQKILFRIIHAFERVTVEVYIDNEDSAVSSHTHCDIEEVDHGVHITYGGLRICYYPCSGISVNIEHMYP